ncbi:hypothetical protein DNTS_008887 [Danionella cerebrum]|uniref:TIR domain-containing protein n=1 Tax=Danionella cerebrum TaxID=2873325 RepID=A0A553MVV1_9TELE|nr:hypothetical protein DNTS_008887 [Danionella translucida]
MGFSRVPLVPPDTWILDISYNAFDCIQIRDLNYLSSLKNLNISNNRISKIQDGAFKNLSSLLYLNLANNKLNRISGGMFHGLTNLTELRLDQNNIRGIEQRAFLALQNLKLVNLTKNYLCHIDDIKPVLASPYLEELYIGRNNFEAFNSYELITPPLSLKKVDFSNNPLVTFHLADNIFPNLRHLDLSYCGQNGTMNWNVTDATFLTSVKTLYFMDVKMSLQNALNVLQSFKNTLNKLRLNANIELNKTDLLLSACSPMLRVLRLNANNIKYISDHMFDPYLSKNALSDDNSVPSELFRPIPNLTKLIISRTQLRSLNFLLNANLSILSTLRAQGNEIDTINKTLIQSLPGLEVLDLQKNTFTCDCDNAFFLNWARTSNSTQVFYLNKYMCSYPPFLRGTHLADFNIESCTLNIDFICFLCSSIVVVLTLIFSFTWQFLRFQVIYAYYFFLAFLYDNKKRKSNSAFQYDAFISYNAMDEPWVMEQLLPKLEGEQGWRLCLHHRDFQPGRPIMDNIIDGIYSSRKTICLISRNYLKSNWCSSEVQVASYRLFDEQNDVLILVFLEDIPTHQLSPYYRMRKLVKKRSYLRLPKPGEDTKIFWHKLKMALENKMANKSQDSLL